MTNQTTETRPDGCDPVRAAALTAAASIVAAHCHGRPISDLAAFKSALEGATIFETYLRNGQEEGK